MKIILFIFCALLIYIGAFYGIGKRTIPGVKFAQKDIKGKTAYILGIAFVIVGLYAMIAVLMS